MIFSSIGLAIAVAHYEVDMSRNFSPLDPMKYPNAMDDPRTKRPSTNLIRLTILATTLISIFCLIRRHYFRNLWLNKYFHDDGETYIYNQFRKVILDN